MIEVYILQCESAVYMIGVDILQCESAVYMIGVDIPQCESAVHVIGVDIPQCESAAYVFGVYIPQCESAVYMIGVYIPPCESSLYMTGMTFHHVSPVYMIWIYVPPCEPPAFRVTENGFGIKLLEQCLWDLHEKCSDFHFIIFGDMNARTGDINWYAGMSDGYSDEREELFLAQLLEIPQSVGSAASRSVSYTHLTLPTTVPV